MKVSVIAPCRNEVSYISSFVSTVFDQYLGESDYLEIELIIADGQSNDGTCQQLETLSKSYPSLLWIDNPLKIVSTGLNLCIEQASSDIVVRMDIHTIYSRNYICNCVRVLRSTNATCVGGPWIARGDSLKQRSIAAAFQTRIGSGGAYSRSLDYCGPVDTVYLGTWWKSDLIKFGGFDTSLVRNQDDELSFRIIRHGGVIWQSPEIQSFYIPRSSFTSLSRQFAQYGYWKFLVIKKHRKAASFRHLLPLIFLTFLFFLASISLFWIPALYVLLYLLLLYFTLLLAVLLFDKTSNPFMVAFAVSVMHFSYGFGSLRGFVDFFLFSRKNSTSMSTLSR